MTAQELSTILRRGLKPITFLVNNNGYTIERLILGPGSSHNDINQWRYAGAASFFDTHDQAIAYRVRTDDELEDALAAARDREALVLIELVMSRLDAPGALVNFARRCAAFNFPQLATLRGHGPCGSSDGESCQNGSRGRRLGVCEPGGLTGVEQLFAVMRKYAEIGTMDFGMCLIRVSEDPLQPATRRKLRQPKARIDRRFRSLIEQGIAEGDLAPCDAKIAAFTVAGALEHPGDRRLAFPAFAPQRRSASFGAVATMASPASVFDPATTASPAARISAASARPWRAIQTLCQVSMTTATPRIAALNSSWPVPAKVADSAPANTATREAPSTPPSTLPPIHEPR